MVNLYSPFSLPWVRQYLGELGSGRGGGGGGAPLRSCGAWPEENYTTLHLTTLGGELHYTALGGELHYTTPYYTRWRTPLHYSRSRITQHFTKLERATLYCDETYTTPYYPRRRALLTSYTWTFFPRANYQEGRLRTAWSCQAFVWSCCQSSSFHPLNKIRWIKPITRLKSWFLL